jgi:L-ascorbate metabolism protein UlaG (beta-lactamase superfamily)
MTREDELMAAHRQAELGRHRSLLTRWLTGAFRGSRPSRIEPLGPVAPGAVSLRYGGHATVLAKYHGCALVMDPMLGHWLGPVRRAVDPGLSVAELAAVEVVLISSGLVDHLHVPTLDKLPRTATLVVPAGCAARVSSLGFSRVVELTVGADLVTAQVRVVAVDAGVPGALGYAVTGPGPSLALFGQASLKGDLGRGIEGAPDVAILPIGGFWPLSFRERHMSPLDALCAFDRLGAGAMIPIRHGNFPLSYEHLDEPLRWLLELAAEHGIKNLWPLEPGQSVLATVSAGHSARVTVSSVPQPDASQVHRAA